jgi:hypothetical protein
MAPFPKFHTKANEEAEARADEARALHQKAADVLADIDALLGEPTTRRRTSRRPTAVAF